VIPESIAEKIKAIARLEDVLTDMQPAGRQFYTACPSCGKIDVKKKKGLMFNPSKQIAKCWSCDWGTNNPVKYLMDIKGMKYPEALEHLAGIHNIELESDEDRKARLAHDRESQKERRLQTFSDRQLRDSGLTSEDVEIEFEKDNATHRRPAFMSGTRDQYGKYTVGGSADDMLIYYHDLDGNPVMYKPEKSTKMFELVRVRWQNPEQHLDKQGRPIKYQSPSGSGTHIYIPQKIREYFKYRKKITRLFIQEGEKKAEKCCKHGIMSIGVMGIQNIGRKDKSLPPEVQLIIQACEVDEVVFMLDSDWDNLSDGLKNGDHIDQRPQSFFYAVKNYKEYMQTLVNVGVSVEIWFGHVAANEKNLKGIDDLMHGSFFGTEKELVADIDYAMHEKQGAGQHVQMYKITTMNDQQLADLWLLNDPVEFAKKHRSQIGELKEFFLKKFKRRFNDDGDLELAEKLMPGEQYWDLQTKQSRTGQEREEIHFHYRRCFNFLRNRGFHRTQMKSGAWDFIQVKNRVVHKVDNYAMKDFVTEFTEEIKEFDVLEMLYRGGPQYLGHEKLSNLKFFQPNIEKAGKDSQCLFFNEKLWEISAEGIKEMSYAEFRNYIWEDKIIDAKVNALKPLLTVTQMNDELRPLVAEEYRHIENREFFVDISPEGEQCQFLRFLRNTSNFTWKQERKFRKTGMEEDAPSLEEQFMNNRHLINKLTAIGYLLHDYKNASELKAVVAMDGRISEVGASNGRTGKSLIGAAIEQVIPQEYIDAKNKKITEDQFLFSDVSEKTMNIFLDDMRANIDFEHFFTLITGKLKVNVKGGARFSLDQADTPKLLCTTNHAINGEGASFRDRQAFMVFSDWYNDEHKPIDDFGVNFFSEWEQTQWNLFFNLMATCLQLYFQSIRDEWQGKNKGIVEPPMEGIEKRRLRQQIGEDFMQWADVKFACNPDGTPVDEFSALNNREARGELWSDFAKEKSHALRYVSTTNFKTRMKNYCKYKGFHFNPNKANKDGIDYGEFRKNHPDRMFDGIDDKSGGIEYFTIASPVWNVAEF
jgi:hypothetical protein